ncbi:MAG: hypothetical protein M3137_13975 [Actinomycetota bacterium]|nr:hypothetical protein [Actinomycetota bacterium]
MIELVHHDYAHPSYGTVPHPFASSSVFNMPLPSVTSSSVGAPTVPTGGLPATLASAPAADLYKFGLPIFSDVTTSTPRYHVTCTQPWGSCGLSLQAVPIPPDAAPNTGSDGRMVIIDPSSGLVYEFWQARRSPTGAWQASWGDISSLSGPGNADVSGKPASTGSGMSPLAGTVTISDLSSGHINHALSFASSVTCPNFVAPAVESDGTTPPPNCLPEGSRVQLDPSINLATVAGITPLELMVGRALQLYGAICTDTAGTSMAFTFQLPPPTANPYPALGAPWDYWNMPHLPWNSVHITSPQHPPRALHPST